MAVLKRAEGGVVVPALCRETSVSTATFYKWRAKGKPPFFVVTSPAVFCMTLAPCVASIRPQLLSCTLNRPHPHPFHIIWVFSTNR